ncbi:MAG: Holliday junction resolvase RuvX [Actinobacteria bacterium]|nr:MAG: Holliday junction resolvase RuvX [Actinomycetota bacterium]
MRLLGLDIGEARVGVAVSDPAGTIASPLVVLDARLLTRDIRPLRTLVDDYEVEGLVVGLPLSMNGSEGRQSATVRAVADRLGKELALPVMYADERLSSATAARAMGSGGVKAKQQRGRLDMVAAAIILQAYLDGQRKPEEL